MDVTTGVEIEGTTEQGVDIQFPFESTPGKDHRATLKMTPLFVDKYPVTNADYATFIAQSNYVPADTEHYLQHWTHAPGPGGRLFMLLLNDHTYYYFAFFLRSNMSLQDCTKGAPRMPGQPRRVRPVCPVSHEGYMFNKIQYILNVQPASLTWHSRDAYRLDSYTEYLQRWPITLPLSLSLTHTPHHTLLPLSRRV